MNREAKKMSKKAMMPYDIRQECLWIVRGYDRRVKSYHAGVYGQGARGNDGRFYAGWGKVENAEDPVCGTDGLQ